MKKKSKASVVVGTIAAIAIITIVPAMLAEKSFKNIRFEREDD